MHAVNTWESEIIGWPDVHYRGQLLRATYAKCMSIAESTIAHIQYRSCIYAWSRLRCAARRSHSVVTYSVKPRRSVVEEQHVRWVSQTITMLRFVNYDLPVATIARQVSSSKRRTEEPGRTVVSISVTPRADRSTGRCLFKLTVPLRDSRISWCLQPRPASDFICVSTSWNVFEVCPIMVFC